MGQETENAQVQEKDKIRPSFKKKSWAEEQDEYWDKMPTTNDTINWNFEHIRDYELIAAAPASVEACESLVEELISSACHSVRYLLIFFFH